MCFAIPGKIVEVQEQACMRMGKIDYGDFTREACLAYIPNPQIGEYVMVHVGFAVRKGDAEEAERTYKYLGKMDQLDEIAAPELRHSREMTLLICRAPHMGWYAEFGNMRSTARRDSVSVNGINALMRVSSDHRSA